MIDKLRRKFMWIIMLILSLSLLGIFVFSGMITYQNMQTQWKESLKVHLTSPQRRPVSEKMPKDEEEKSEKEKKIPKEKPKQFVPPKDSSVVLILRYSKDGRQIECQSNSIFPLDEDSISHLGKMTLNLPKDSGKIAEYDLAYLRCKKGEETEIGYYDLSGQQNTLRRLFITFVVTYMGAIILFYAISRWLSNWCIRPVEDAICSQQNFVADASHELKTPLTVILANISLLRTHREDTIQSQMKYLDYIDDESKHMSRLVNDLLFLARSDAKQERMDFAEVDFSSICLNGYLPFESIAYEKGIALEEDIDDGIMVYGDENKLGQLIAIFMDNAMKYCGPSGRVRIELKKQDKKVRLSVYNTGEIIPAAKIAHVKERFYRVDESRTTVENGYGLGLSIADCIVLSHKGTWKITSKEGEGTCVEVIFGG